jgi:hypothetical protein
MRVTESTFQPKRIAGDKKSPKLGKQSGRPHGATKPDQLVVCTENQILQ